MADSSTQKKHFMNSKCLCCDKDFKLTYPGQLTCGDPKCESELDRRKKQYSILEKAGLTMGLYGKMELSNFDWSWLESVTWLVHGDKGVRKPVALKNRIEKYILKIPETGITFLAHNGVGKTHLGIGITKSLIRNHLIHPVVVSFPHLLNRLRDSYDRNGSTSLLKYYKNTSLFFLDEIGKEKPSDTGWVPEILFMILDGRVVNGVPTIMTSNLDIIEISERYGSAVASRMMENTEIISITADDYREVIQKKMIKDKKTK